MFVLVALLCVGLVAILLLLPKQLHVHPTTTTTTTTLNFNLTSGTPFLPASWMALALQQPPSMASMPMPMPMPSTVYVCAANSLRPQGWHVASLLFPNATVKELHDEVAGQWLVENSSWTNTAHTVLVGFWPRKKCHEVHKGRKVLFNGEAHLEMAQLYADDLQAKKALLVSKVNGK